MSWRGVLLTDLSLYLEPNWQVEGAERRGTKFPDQKSGGHADSGGLSRSDTGIREEANVKPHRQQNIWDRQL